MRRTTPKAVAARIAKMADDLPEAVRDVAVQAVDAAATRMPSASPRDTGTLASSWVSRETDDGAELVNRTGYARYQRGLTEQAADIVAEETRNASFELP